MGQQEPPQDMADVVRQLEDVHATVQRMRADPNLAARLQTLARLVSPVAGNANCICRGGGGAARE